MYTYVGNKSYCNLGFNFNSTMTTGEQTEPVGSGHTAKAASGNWKSERLTNFVLSRRHLGHYPFTVAPSSRRGQALLVSFLRANNICGAAAAAATGWEAVAASCELMLRLAHCAVSLWHTVGRSPAWLCALSLARLTSTNSTEKWRLTVTGNVKHFRVRCFQRDFTKQPAVGTANAPQFSLSYGNIAHKATASCCLLLFHHHDHRHHHHHLVSLRSCWQMICRHDYAYIATSARYGFLHGSSSPAPTD